MNVTNALGQRSEYEAPLGLILAARNGMCLEAPYVPVSTPRSISIVYVLKWGAFSLSNSRL